MTEGNNMARQQPLEKINIIPRDEPSALVPVTPMDMLNRAVSSGADIVMIEKLMALQERWEAGQARKAFDEAIAAAKAKIKPILKTQKGHTGKYEDLAAIATEIDPILSENGLSYRYRARQDEKVHVTCVLSHKAGYSEETELSEKPDVGPGRNAIQALGSCLTYLQRYSLKLALGLSAAKDDDGRAVTNGGEAITQPQVETIVELMDSVNADRPKFLTFFKIERLSDLPAKRFDEAITMLNAKRGNK